MWYFMCLWGFALVCEWHLGIDSAIFFTSKLSSSQLNLFPFQIQTSLLFIAWKWCLIVERFNWDEDTHFFRSIDSLFHFHRCIYWPSFLTFSISSIFICCPTFQKNLVTINMIGYGMFWQIQPQQLYEHWGKCHCSHIHLLDMNSRPTFVCWKETNYHPQVTLQWLNKLITWIHYVKKAAKDLKLQKAHPLLLFFGK
jgi:hypothetical protein